MKDDKTVLPLKGIRVLELSTVVAAPTTARMLCAYGADVIKVEALHGDELRGIGRLKKAPYADYKNPIFTVSNSNKRLTSINLKAPEGKAAIWKLLANTDVVVTNIREASLRRLGLDYASVSEEFPSLIYGQFYGYGPEGPSANDPGFDSTAFWMRSGPLADWTVRGEHPFYPTYAFGDMATSSVLLSGILIALYARERTGLGTMVNTSLLASGIWCNANGVVSTQFENKRLNPDYTHPLDPFDTFYECGDGNWIAVYCNQYERDLAKFARHLGMLDILEDPRWATPQSLEEDDFLPQAVERVAAVFRTKSAYAWREQLSADNISCEVMRRTCDVCRDPQALANGYVEEMEFADGLKVMMPCPPIHFSEYGRRDYANTGPVGADTDEVFQELGYSLKEIATLRKAGVIR